MQVVGLANTYLDPRANINAFYSDIFDVMTAQGIGLDIWGRIVGVSRVLTVPASNINFGFHDTTSGVSADYGPFGQAVFNTGSVATSNYTLSDEAFLTLILVKAAANITRATIAALNQMLQTLFPGRGRCYVTNFGNMQMRYTFEFYLQPFEFAIVTTAGVLPAPAAVLISAVQQPQYSTFGFKEAGSASAVGFGQGTFLPDGATVIN